VYVEDATAVLAAAPTRDALEQQAVVHFEQHDSIERLADLTEHRGETLGLRNGARKAIKDEATRGIRRGQALTHHAEDGGIVDELTRVHDSLRPTTELAAIAYVGTQQVSRGDLRDAVPFD
jgi:hypothetical protein